MSDFMKYPLLLLAPVLACSSGRLVARSPTPGRAHLTVMTYNVNYGIPGDAPTIQAIRQGDTDLVCLQETTPAWESSLRHELAERYPHMAFVTAPGAGGLGLLSAAPFENLGVQDNPRGWFPSWRVRVHAPAGDVQVLLVHLHPPVSESGSYVSGYFSTGDRRRQEILQFTRALDLAQPTLVVGDFNESGGAALRHLSGLGLRDVVDEFGLGTTWHWPTSFGDLRMTFDHVFHSPQLTPLNAWVRQAGRSDHLPVVAVFEL